MPAANTAAMSATGASAPAPKKASLPAEKKYQCQYCSRAFSRSEHRGRHERSHTKERPFKCLKCRSTFVRRDLLLRHDRTVHAKDGGAPLVSDGKRRATKAAKTSMNSTPSKAPLPIETSALEQIEQSGDAVFDVEAAAMLVADLHHKATAAARASVSPPSPYESNNNSFAQDQADMVEQAVTYPNGAIGLTNWEGFVSQAKSHSISASTSPSYDTPKSFPSNGTSHHHPPPPLVNPVPMPHSASTVSTHSSINSLVPAMQNMINSLPGPVDTQGPQSPSNAPFKTPQLASEEDRAAIVDNIRASDSEHAIPEGFRVPPLSTINRYLSTYFTMFHHHLPFLHPSSFDPAQVAPPLLLAVLSIGSLYGFDQESAYMLHIGSKILVSQFLQNKENFSSRKCPLWTMQSSLLNMIFASWSGDPKGLEWACSIKSLLANMVAGNRYELKLRQAAREANELTRDEWVEDEGCRRTYYAVYIFFGLLTLTYNHTPAISFNEFEDLLLPSPEAMWNLAVDDEEVWRQQLNESPSVTFMAAHDNLFQGSTIRYSAFATRVMINALFLEVWYHKRCPEALQDVVTEYKLRLALDTWEKSLELCDPDAMPSSLLAPHKCHPLIFNATAMFRNARARLEVDLKTVQEALRYHDSYEVAAAMSHARDRVNRGSGEMLKVIQDCYNCIETAVVQGVRWVARTSPTNWSIEHPLCGMDLMIILSMWLYRLEHDDGVPFSEGELAMYNKIRGLFSKDPRDPEGPPHLSSNLAKLWGSMLDEVVVWGISKLMGESFRLHAQALVGYVDDLQSSNVTTPSMTSQADEESLY